MINLKKTIISFIIPVFNAEKYLQECIDSILSNNIDEIEIILVDDGSTDNSSIICNNYASKNENVHAFHKENDGVASARNLGIEKSSGEYIFFVDNDDLINGDKIKNLLNVIKNNKYDLIINNYCILDKETIILGNSFINKNNINNKASKDVLNYLRKKRINIMAPWEYVVKKEVLVKNNLFFNSNQSGFDDSCFSPILFCFCEKFFVNEDIIYFWRQRTDSQGKKSIDFDSILKIISTIYELEKFILKINKDYKINYIYHSIYKNIYFLIGHYYHLPKENRSIVKVFFNKNKKLIKESVKRSGLFHILLNFIFGSFYGLIISYKLAVLKGFIFKHLHRTKNF